jgi:hypothetical protein
MNVVVWVLAGFGLLLAAVALASVVDRRAGWSRIPFDAAEDEAANPHGVLADSSHAGRSLARGG